MIKPVNLFPIAIAAALVVTACGGDDDSSAPLDSPATDVAPDTTAEIPDETIAEPAVDEAAPEPSDAASGDGEATKGCASALTSEEIGSILGTTPEISGSGEQCQHSYASDAIGTFQAYSGSKADQAIETLLVGFQDDETKSGVLLDDGRGYVLDGTFTRSVVVRGDSGQVFVFTAPDNLDVADIQLAMQNIADLLLTR